jgi:hypothetical protein
MIRKHALALLLCATLLITTGCEQQSIAEQEAIKNAATLAASTPSATPSPTITPSPTETPTLTPTLGPSPTPTITPSPTITPIPTITPLPPTPTPNPALANFSLCSQLVGEPDGGRFSAQINAITTTVQPAFERVTIGLAVPNSSAPPHAIARCLSAADDPAAAPGAGYSLLVDMGDWLHDDAFKATAISPTQALSGTTLLKSLNLRFDQNAVAGATLAFALEQPLPYRLTLEQNPYRLVLEVAKSGAIGPSSDTLSAPTTNTASPSAPLFYVQDGDVWKFDGGKATNLTTAARAGQFGAVSDLAASQAASQVAFCATAPGADVGDRLAQSQLWSIDFDGKNVQSLASQGLSCAEPAFSPDGKTIAFTVDETGANPPRLSLWTVSASGGDEQRLTAQGDEWSRFGPQWIDGGRLVYAAQAEDGRSTLFVFNTANGSVRDIGAELMKGEAYQSLGGPLAAPDGTAIAVEGLRANDAGADQLRIDPNGELLPSQGQIAGGYWNRPLAWSADGMLFYLTTACPSDVAQTYALHARALKDGDDRLIAAGATLGGFGSFAAPGNGLAYVTLEHVPAGSRGPLRIDPQSQSTLWFWDVGGGGARAKLVSAQSAIGSIAP